MDESFLDVMFAVAPKDEHPLLVMVKHGFDCECDHCSYYRQALREADQG